MGKTSAEGCSASCYTTLVARESERQSLRPHADSSKQRQLCILDAHIRHRRPPISYNCLSWTLLPAAAPRQQRGFFDILTRHTPAASEVDRPSMGILFRSHGWNYFSIFSGWRWRPRRVAAEKDNPIGSRPGVSGHWSIALGGAAGLRAHAAFPRSLCQRRPACHAPGDRRIRHEAGQPPCGRKPVGRVAKRCRDVLGSTGFVASVFPEH